MQLTHGRTLMGAEQAPNKVQATAWSPNCLRLAAATKSRVVHLFDEHGDRRDKFSTKPADSQVRGPPGPGPAPARARAPAGRRPRRARGLGEISAGIWAWGAPAGPPAGVRGRGPLRGPALDRPVPPPAAPGP